MENILVENIELTEKLMNSLSIPLRDTWVGIKGKNLDDFYSNNNSFDGVRRLCLTYCEVPNSQTVHKKMYNLANYNHVAYDRTEIQIPPRLKELRHPIIHELVHFLQINTPELDANYLQYAPDQLGALKYFCQPQEKEAFLVQIMFISQFEPDLLQKLHPEVESRLKELIETVHSVTSTEVLPLILESKTSGLI